MSLQTENQHNRIVIVGGGAGGLELAVRLGKSLGRTKKATIILVDATPTHVWKPLLHQVAAGTLNSHADELEYFAVASANHFSFCLGTMTGLNRSTKELSLSAVHDEHKEEILPSRVLHYDTLVLSVGSLTNDFGTKGVREHSIMLDTAYSAGYFHQQLINRCLRKQAQQSKKTECFTITIIGGGATGIELSAELTMAIKYLSMYGLADVQSGKEFKIVIADAAPRLLSMLPERLSNAVRRELTALNVEIHLQQKVVEVSEHGVKMENGLFIPSDMVVWAAGIKAPDFLKHLDGLETNRLNQLTVSRTLQTTQDSSIFAFGDCAACPQAEGQKNGSLTVPPRAQAAHQQAAMLAKSLQRRVSGQPLLEFVYKDYGSLVSLGKFSTVGSLMGSITRGSLFIEGQFAKWMYWSLYKKHQMVVNGWFYTLLSVVNEAINRVKNPRIKLH